MSRPAYDRPEDNEWFRPARKGWKLACCDCGLIHAIDFKVSRGAILMRARRLPERKNGDLLTRREAWKRARR